MAEKAYRCRYCEKFESDNPVDIEIHWQFDCPYYSKGEY